jgi:hypothetical protein
VGEITSNKSCHEKIVIAVVQGEEREGERERGQVKEI